MKIAAITLTVALLLTGATGAALARTPATNYSVGTNVATVTPLPMRMFCAREPAQCRSTRAASVAWSDDLANTLHRVNVAVNNAIRPLANPPGGWKTNPRAGDCNDYALTKRAQLISMGIPAGALRIAITKTRSGTPHAVLVVKTNEGDIVLDNLNSRVRTLAQTGYRISMLSSANPTKWVRG